MVIDAKWKYKLGGLAADCFPKMGATEDAYMGLSEEQYKNLPRELAEHHDFNDLMAKIAKCEKNTQAVLRIRDYWDNLAANLQGGRGIFISGPPGTGKSAVIVYLLKRIPKAIYFESFEMSRLIRLSWKNDVARDFLDHCIYTSDALAIDDLGKIKDLKGDLQDFLEIFNIRFNLKKPVFCSTNLKIEQVFEESFLSRLYKYETVHLGGDDLRKPS